MNILSPRSERETTITIYDKLAKIWTNEESMITKLDKMVAKFPETYKCTQVWKVAGQPDTIANKEYEVDRRRISFTSPRDPEMSLRFKGKSALEEAKNEDN